MYSQSKLSSVNTTADLALRRDIEDVLAPRRVSNEQFVNLPGVDGGEGSAGNIPIDPGREARIAEAPSSNTLVAHHDESIRIFGPYWTSAAAVVLVGEFHSTEWPRGFTTLCSRAAESIGERASREHRVFLGRAP